MTEESTGHPNAFLHDRYDLLWSNSIQQIRSGLVEIDQTLAHDRADRRRGMTLLFRPSEQIQERVKQLLNDLREIEPDQYYYHPSELHVTFLSLFTATEDYEPLFAHAEEYAAAVAASVARLHEFTVSFAGITASPGAVMIQGFTDVASLNSARDNLRSELRSRGLSRGLDERYRLETAHMTAVRFRQPLRKGDALVEMLNRRRACDFGEFRVNALELVKNDWYMSRENMEHLSTYRFST
jgi:2'-5' RNA ligase